LLDGLAMYLSCDTKKFHDNESTHILHNFWTSTHRIGGKLPPFPLAAPLTPTLERINTDTDPGPSCRRPSPTSRRSSAPATCSWFAAARAPAADIGCRAQQRAGSVDAMIRGGSTRTCCRRAVSYELKSRASNKPA